MTNVYLSAVIGILVVPEAVVEPAYLLGILTAEGDLIGYTASVGRPVWVVKAALFGTFLLSAFVLWHVVPEFKRAASAQFRILFGPQPLRVEREPRPQPH